MLHRHSTRQRCACIHLVVIIIIPVDSGTSHVLPLVVLPQPSSHPVVEAAYQAAYVGRVDAGLECCPSGSPEYYHHHPVAWPALDSVQPYLKVGSDGREGGE